MSLAVNNFAGVQQASEKLDAAVLEYNNALDTILSLIEGTKANWEGSDADAFRAKATKAIGQPNEGQDSTSLRKVGEVMASHAITLRSISDALTKTSRNIKNSMGE